MTRDERSPPRDLGGLALGLGLVASVWALLIVVPAGPALPAWPAASVGVLALFVSRLPGRAWARGLGAFLGVLGIVVGLVKIAALWGLVKLIG
jgi:hypothetical protein